NKIFIINIFFFKAEDGIRYGHVTGVQTCALPICNAASGRLIAEQGEGRKGVVDARFAAVDALARGGEARFAIRQCRAGERRVCRSEERRVGKECRSRWLPYY